MQHTVVSTERLRLRPFAETDADFVIELLNQPSFLKHIGDRGVRNRRDAIRYINEGPRANLEQYGYCAYVMERASDGRRMGMCGLFRREPLPVPDLGFALLDSYVGHGFAAEASRGVLAYAQRELELSAIGAITDAANHRSRVLLQRLGFAPRGQVRLPDETAPLEYYHCDLTDNGSET